MTNYPTFNSFTDLAKSTYAQRSLNAPPPLEGGATAEGTNSDIAEHQLMGYRSSLKKHIELQNNPSSTPEQLSASKAKLNQEREKLVPNVKKGLVELADRLETAKDNNIQQRVKYLTAQKTKIYDIREEINRLEKNVDD